MQRKGRQLLIGAGVILMALTTSFLIYTSHPYRADATAEAALDSKGPLTVTRTSYGWHFDGPSTHDALLFYPGGLVEEVSFAPLLSELARQGLDCCLLAMPFHLAILDPERATQAIPLHDYDHWYVGGHSLGGVVASSYAARHPDEVETVVLLASYPAQEVPDPPLTIMIWGTEDGVLNRERLAEALEHTVPSRLVAHEIQGANHAQFGSYGPQEGDHAARVSATRQRAEATSTILRALSLPRDRDEDGVR